jgi:hypothetical protein
MRETKFQIHPLSILIIFCFIFLVTFLHIQLRQKSYQLSENLKQLRQLKEKKIKLEIQKSQIQRPTHVQKMAEKMTLRKASFDQVIIMSPDRGEQ